MFSGSKFHLCAGQQERADTFWIVSDNLFTQIILITSVTIRTAAETCDADRACEINLPVCVRFDEPIDDALITFLRDSKIRGRQVALPDSLRERIDEHAGGGRFPIVTPLVALIEYLIPQARLRLLVSLDGHSKATQNRNQLLTLGLSFRKIIQRINQRHGVPAQRTAAEIG